MNTETLVVCGASSDIGLALLRSLLADPNGPRIIAHSNRGLERVAALFEASPERGSTIVADLSTAEGCSSLVFQVAAIGAQPTQFVHFSALPLVYERFEKFDWNHFNVDLAIQVGALTRILPEWLPRPRRGGSLRSVVVVSSSVTSGVPPKFMSMYTAAKYAQLGLMRALAAEYAERGVTVNCVSPSMVETRFLDKIPGTAREMNAAGSPLKRNAQPEEVAEVIALLLSKHRPLLSGSNLVLGGGAVF